MEKCLHRLATDMGLAGPINEVAARSGFAGATIAGERQLRQKFKHGLCALLTINDIGPVECRQPNCSENNCPDIAHLLKI